MALFLVDENRGEIKQYKEAWNKIKYLIDLENDDSGNYDKKHMKLKFKSNDYLPLIRKLEMYNVVIIITHAFYNNNKYYPGKKLNEDFIN